MKETKLWQGVVLGAVAGAAIMMFDRDTRSYVGEKSRLAGSTCKSYVTHPSEAVHTLRVKYEYMSTQLNKTLEDLLDILNKTEEVLNKVGKINQEVGKQLESADDSKEAS